MENFGQEGAPHIEDIMFVVQFKDSNSEMEVKAGYCVFDLPASEDKHETR